jgi:hypothetical protein
MNHRPTAVQGRATALLCQSGGTGPRQAAANSAACFDLAIAEMRADWIRNRHDGETAEQYLVRMGRNTGYFAR